MPRGDFFVWGSNLRTHRHTVVLILLLLSVFGPYVSGPLRTEHFVVYGLLVLFAANKALEMIRDRHPHQVAASTIYRSPWYVAAWLSLAGLALLGSLSSGDGRLLGSRSALAALDGILLPVGAFVVALSVFRRLHDTKTAEILTLSVAVLVSLNSCLAVMQGFGVGGGIWDRFHQDLTSTGLSTFERNAERLTGVFNQPIEAGLAHSIAVVVLAVFLNHRPRLQIFLFSAIALGGFISVSKVFFFAGIPLAIAVAFLTSGWRKAISLATASLVMLLGGSLFPKTLDIFQRLFVSLTSSAPDQSVFYILTAGRTYSLEPEVAPNSLGLLLGGGLLALERTQVPLDSAPSVAFAMGGSLGLLFWALTLLGIAFQTYLCPPGPMKLFQGALTVLILAASGGFEPLSSNRTGPLIWILLSFTWSAVGDRRRGTKPRRNRLED